MIEYKIIFVWLHPVEDFAGELTVRGHSLQECMRIGEGILAESGMDVIDCYTDNEL